MFLVGFLVDNLGMLQVFLFFLSILVFHFEYCFSNPPHSFSHHIILYDCSKQVA